MTANPKCPHILTLLPAAFMVAGLICLAVAGWGSVAPAFTAPRPLSVQTGAAVTYAAVSRVGLASLVPAPASPADPQDAPAGAGDNNLPLWIGVGALGVLLVLEGGALALDARQAH